MIFDFRVAHQVTHEPINNDKRVKILSKNGFEFEIKPENDYFLIKVNDRIYQISENGISKFSPVMKPEATFSICADCEAEIRHTDDASYCPECQIIEGDTLEVTQREWENIQDGTGSPETKLEAFRRKEADIFPGGTMNVSTGVSPTEIELMRDVINELDDSE